MQRSDNARMLRWIGFGLLAAGLLGHVLAARAIGGTYIAYRDHLLGFVALTVVCAAILALVGRRYWRGQSERMLVVNGVIQVCFGVFAYVMRYRVHG